MSKKKKYKKDGKMDGPSHDKGGIPGVVGKSKEPIEFEGGEFIINKNKNNAAGIHGEDLRSLNEDPEAYKIIKRQTESTFEDGGYVYPVSDAKKRRG